jgi:hypothetical protein
MFFSNSSIRTKILSGFLFVSFILTIASAFIIYNIFSIKEKSDEFTYYKHYTVISKDLQTHIANVWQFFTDASLTKDPKVIVEEAKPNYDTCLAISAELSGMIPFKSKGFQNKSAEIKGKLDRMFETGNRMFAAYSQSWESGNVVMDEYDKVCDDAISFVNDYVGVINSNSMEISNEIDVAINQTILVTSISLAMVLILSIFFGLFVSKKISDPIKFITRLVEELSKGNLKGYDELLSNYQIINK